LRRHVDQQRRAQLVAGPLTLQQIAEKASAEGLSLLDYLILIRSTLMARFLAASDCGDNQNTALLAGRLTECLRLVAQVTGELSRATSTVNNNTLIMASPDGRLAIDARSTTAALPGGNAIRARRPRGAIRPGIAGFRADA
jgi:hypothetical protein